MLEIGPNSFGYPALALVAGFLGGQPAPWTTVDYAFRPTQRASLGAGAAESREQRNWSVPTIGVRARASCHSLDTPIALFDKVEVAGSGTTGKAPLYGYELHDPISGLQSVENNVFFNHSVFRVPSSRAGSKVREGPRYGTIQGVMSRS
jgi:hypothetical protein